MPPSYAHVVTALRSAGCVFAEDEARLILSTARTPAELTVMVDRRVAGLPLEHVLGWAEFRGLRIAVEPGVFVPRRRTEFLVEQAVALAPEATVVVDLCCGSGAVGVALAAALPGVELHAADVDPAAVRCARRNVGAGAHVYEGISSRRCRVPFAGASAFWPPMCRTFPAVRSGCCRPRPVTMSPWWLSTGVGTGSMSCVVSPGRRRGGWRPAGSLLVETSERQAGLAVEILADAGLIPRLKVSEELYANVVIGLKGS